MTTDPYSMMDPYTQEPPPPERSGNWLFVPLLCGAAVSVALGVYGNMHQPTGIAVNISGFSSQQTVKVWLASGAAALAIVQLVSA